MRNRCVLFRLNISIIFISMNMVIWKYSTQLDLRHPHSLIISARLFSCDEWFEMSHVKLLCRDHLKSIVFKQALQGLSLLMTLWYRKLLPPGYFAFPCRLVKILVELIISKLIHCWKNCKHMLTKFWVAGRL